MTSEEKPDMNSKKILVLGLLTALILAAGAVLSYTLLVSRSTHAPIPSSVRDKIDFPLYYPSSLPHDYVLDDTSVKTQDDIVSYTLRNKKDSIYVSEQEVPNPPPDIKMLQEALSFKVIDTPLGNAVIGMDTDKPTAVLVTNTTLINIYADKDVPADVVINLVKSMASLPR